MLARGPRWLQDRRSGRGALSPYVGGARAAAWIFPMRSPLLQGHRSAQLIASQMRDSEIGHRVRATARYWHKMIEGKVVLNDWHRTQVADHAVALHDCAKIDLRDHAAAGNACTTAHDASAFREVAAFSISPRPFAHASAVLFRVPRIPASFVFGNMLCVAGTPLFRFGVPRFTMRSVVRKMFRPMFVVRRFVKSACPFWIRQVPPTHPRFYTFFALVSQAIAACSIPVKRGNGQSLCTAPTTLSHGDPCVLGHLLQHFHEPHGFLLRFWPSHLCARGQQHGGSFFAYHKCNPSAWDLQCLPN